MSDQHVIVPVEPTERLAQYVKGTSPYRAWRGAPPEGEPTLKSDIAALLSAAPAPEGGAVEATGAKAVIRNGKIVISIDVDALPLILSGSIALNAVAGTFKVTDAATFAKEVCYALNAEKEDGTTRVHMMFDSAFDHAIDKGAEGIEEISEDEFEAEAARLQDEAKTALATREEAQAEAWKRCASCGAGPAGNCGYYDCETPRNTCPLAAPAEAGEPKYFAAFMAEDGALRAQPPAREDTQPVALTAAQLADALDWFWNAALGASRERQTEAAADVASVMAAGMAAVAQGLRESITHPAPDALRVAVEALERARQSIEGWYEAQSGEDFTEAGHAVFLEDIASINQALAALQAEQGAK